MCIRSIAFARSVRCDVDTFKRRTPGGRVVARRHNTRSAREFGFNPRRENARLRSKYRHGSAYLHIIDQKTMGCASSSRVYRRSGFGATEAEIMQLFSQPRPGQDRNAAKELSMLQLTLSEIKTMFGIFRSIDRDGSGAIDLGEFYAAFKMQPTPFADRVFSLMDSDCSGEIDFKEFVASVWNLASFSRRALTKFAFDLFDLDASGYLSMDEVQKLVVEVYGQASERNVRLHRIVETVDKNGDDQISWEEWMEWNRRNPIILFPAFQMQQVVRRHVLGEAFWAQEQAKRITMDSSMGRGLNIFEILSGVDLDGLDVDAETFAAKMKKAQNQQQEFTQSLTLSAPDSRARKITEKYAPGRENDPYTVKQKKKQKSSSDKQRKKHKKHKSKSKKRKTPKKPQASEYVRR